MTDQSTTGCGRTKTVGHGDVAVCGKPNYGEMYLCECCLKKRIAELERKNAELERQIASFAQGAKISIPTATMEQEFQSHYRRGYAAGIAASHQKEDKA